MTFRQSIPAFLGGISQQSKAIRPTNLVDDAVNMEFLPSEGATKRYPTEWVADLGITLDASKAHAVAMPRDDEDYVVVVDDTTVRVFDSAGVAQTVTEAGNAFDYLTGATHGDFRFQQIADTLYVGNSNTVVAGEPGRDYAPWRQAGDAGVFIRQTAYDHTYTLIVGGTTVSVTTQTTPNTLGGLGYSGSNTAASAQPYRLTAGQAAGTDPIYVDTLQTPCRTNSLDEFDIRTIDASRLAFNVANINTALLNGYAVASTNAEPTSGQPDANHWLSNYSDGTGIDSVTAAHFDDVFQAVYLDPAEGHQAGDWIAISRGTITNQSQLSTQYVARQLAAALVAADPSITVEGDEMYQASSAYTNSSSFFLTAGPAVPTALRLDVADHQSSPVDDYAYIWSDEIEEITHLPVHFKQGAVVRVTGDPTSGEDDYFVQFATDEWRETTDNDEDRFFTYSSDLFGRGSWRETTEPGLSTGGLDSSTMPHRLQRDSGGNWTFSSVGWGTRPSGDNLTNPEPSFVGSRIFDIFYHEDRLGFAADANVIMSESGEVENFWRTTVLSVPGSDPIDITLAALGGNAVYHVVPFDRRLFAFSESAQAAISGGDGGLTPATVSAKVTGGYRTSPSISPVPQGMSLFSAFTTGTNMQVREMMPGQYEGDLQAAEITLAVPRLLPNTIRKVLVSSGGNDLICLSESGQFFLYQYLRAGQQNLMSAWGRWTFDGGSLVDAVTIRDLVYVLVNRDGTTRMEKIFVGSGRGDVDTAFKPRVDRLASISGGTFDFATNSTTFQVPYDFAATDTVLLVSKGTTLEYGAPIPVTSQDAATNTVTVSMDLSTEQVWVGTKYDSKLVMTHPVVQTPAQQGGRTSVVGGNTLVRDIAMSLTDTGYLKATVEAVGQSTSTEEFLADRMDVGEISPSVLSSREFLVPIHASADEFRLTLSNDTAMPSTLVNGAWAVRFNARYRQL